MAPILALALALPSIGCADSTARTSKSWMTAIARLAAPGGRAGVRARSAQFVAMKRGLGQRTPILTYHDVVAVRDRDSVWFDVSTSELTQQLNWLTAHGAHFITVESLYDHLIRGSKLPNGATVITFADNYEGFYLRALPILRSRRIPVAMFVHTGYVGDRAHGRPKMGWAQLQQLDREGLVTVCSQTVTHPADLRKLSNRALRKEMVDSKRSLEWRLGHPILFLAYPDGVHDARIERAARDAGYAMAVSEGMRPAERSKSILAVDRYVHTRYRQAWKDAGRR